VQCQAPTPLLAGLAIGDLIAFRIAETAAPDGLPLLQHLVREGGPLAGRWQAQGDATRWRRPGQIPSRMALLRLRHQVLQTLRRLLDAQDFLEVETPALVRAPSPEPQFAPFAVGRDYLSTSPEFQLKRLLVGGFERVYRLGPAFRAGEQGRQHNPEFTLLEWYRAHADSTALADDLHAILAALAPLAEAFAATVGRPPGLRREWLRQPLPQMSVAALFQRHLNVELRGLASAAQLRQAAERAGLGQALQGLPDAYDALFSALWVALEPRIGPEPLLVVDWPAPLASLARLKPGDPSLAERMELYVGGLELANGFAELTDAAQQRQRFEAHLAQRRAQGLPALPLDEAFLGALEQGLPPSAGMALGVDRLVMVVAGVQDIALVLSLAFDER